MKWRTLSYFVGHENDVNKALLKRKRIGTDCFVGISRGDKFWLLQYRLSWSRARIAFSRNSDIISGFNIDCLGIFIGVDRRYPIMKRVIFDQAAWPVTLTPSVTAVKAAKWPTK